MGEIKVDICKEDDFAVKLIKNSKQLCSADSLACCQLIWRSDLEDYYLQHQNMVNHTVCHSWIIVTEKHILFIYFTYIMVYIGKCIDHILYKTYYGQVVYSHEYKIHYMINYNICYII